MDHPRKSGLLVEKMNSLPSAERQLAFIQRIQRLFEEGDFSATYKFALLIALSELAIEFGKDNGDSLEMPILLIARKFAELYWPQSLPYSMNSSTGVLSQNPGRQAAVVSQLNKLRQAGANSLLQATKLSVWPVVLKSIAVTVKDMPVRHLQNLGGEPDHFLYDYPTKRDSLVLKPGVGYLLRRFHGLIQQLSRSGWVRHVRQNSQNALIIGKSDDLEAFMFGSSRSNLEKVAEVLHSIQSGQCFYCASSIRGDGDVDHFIPWAKYPRDLAHNFVLTHGKCNRSKSDMLGGRMHLENWLRRNDRYGADISDEMEKIGFVANPDSILTVAKWAYWQGAEMGAHAWLEKSHTERIDHHHLAVLA